MATKEPKNILIAPLDWGLGHTTRCIPIINYLLQQGHCPVIAGNASQLSFFRDTFGGAISTLILDGYDIRYSRWNRVAQIGLLAQMPSIVNKIKQEQRWLRELCRDHKIDGIISDNRYGLYHNDIPSVIITHQLQIRSGIGGIVDRMVRSMHYNYLERFSGIWVPDVEQVPGIGGALSHPAILPAATTYIGLLSRFEAQPEPDAVKGQNLVILLSGPEPQRTELANMLWQQALDYKGSVVFVEGSEDATAPDHIPHHISYYKRLAQQALSPIFAGAAMVISRSGYSGIMDLVALRKKAILIPTPGQTEQQYLAEHLYSTGQFFTARQDGFDLVKTIAGAEKFAFNPVQQPGSYLLYRTIIDNWLQQL